MVRVTMQAYTEWDGSYQSALLERCKTAGNDIVAERIFEKLCESINRAPKSLLNTRLVDIVSKCNRTREYFEEKQGAPSAMEKENRPQNTYHLRSQRTPNYTEMMKTPLQASRTGFVAKTSQGIVRVPYTITPKARRCQALKFRQLGRDEVAFSVKGTPVVATEADDSVQIVAELLHAEVGEFTPKTRELIDNMKELVGKLQGM